MPPSTAAALFAAGILGLFVYNRDGASQTSPALWIAVLWVAIGASRMVSEWLGAGVPIDSPDQYLEGSPFDRLFLTGMLVLALGVLVARSVRTQAILRANWPLVVFFLYCALSALWSEYPSVTFKRWTKGVGNFVMVLVVLTDPNPSIAIKRLLTWTGFLLIPLSVLFIKYYSDIGRGYDRWLGTAYYNGVTTEKNSLGRDLLVFGLGSLWSFLEAFRHPSHKVRQLITHGTVLVMVGWLFHMANSATSWACFLIGASLIALLITGRATGRSANVHVIVGAMASVAVFAHFMDVSGYFVQALGRDTTLTGRTNLWGDLLPLVNAPWFGTGFESFFLGRRLEYLWSKYWWHPNEAHNGYLETYLTLGWIGIGLLGMVILSGYRNIVSAYRRDHRIGSLKIAIFVAALIYNMSEAGFKVMNPVWVVFLLVVTAVPQASPLVDDKKLEKKLEEADSRTVVVTARDSVHSPTARTSGWRRWHR